jgi:integrase
MTTNVSDKLNIENNPDSRAPKELGEIDAMMAAARQRQSSSAKDGFRSKPAEAILELAPLSNPVTRYLANRNARPASMSTTVAKIRRARKFLIEAGADEKHATQPVESFPWHCVDQELARAFAQLLERRYSNFKSRENLLGVVRQLLRECASVELMSYSQCERVLDCLPVKAGPRKRAGRELADVEISKLLLGELPGKQWKHLRDKAIIAVFLSTALRVSEVAEICMDDLDLDPEVRSVHVNRTKGGTSRTVWLSESAVDFLKSWLEARGTHGGAVFHSAYLPGQAMCTESIRAILRRRGRALGITRNFTSHDLRRTFATRALRQDVDVFTVQRLLGHKNVQTTLVYDRRTEIEDRAVVNSLELPSLTRRAGSGR